MSKFEQLISPLVMDPRIPLNFLLNLLNRVIEDFVLSNSRVGQLKVPKPITRDLDILSLILKVE